MANQYYKVTCSVDARTDAGVYYDDNILTLRAVIRPDKKSVGKLLNFYPSVVNKRGRGSKIGLSDLKSSIIAAIKSYLTRTHKLDKENTLDVSIEIQELSPLLLYNDKTISPEFKMLAVGFYLKEDEVDPNDWS